MLYDCNINILNRCLQIGSKPLTAKGRMIFLYLCDKILIHMQWLLDFKIKINRTALF